MDSEQGRAFIREHRGEAHLTKLQQASDQATAAATEMLEMGLFTRHPDTTPEEALLASARVLELIHQNGVIPSPTVHVVQVLIINLADAINEIHSLKEQLAAARGEAL